jgi:transposase
MFTPTVCVVLPPADRAQLARVVANGNTPQKLALRATVMLMLADHVAPSAVAARFDLSRNQIYLWTQRYLGTGVPGLLHDAPRPGRRKRMTPAQVAAVVDATLHTRPPAATQWSTRTMAHAQGISEATVRRIWHQHGLQPHRVKRFKLSKDPQFVDKLRDVVGLYLNPPKKAVVFCVDEKSGIQALDRTRPVLPLQPGVPERQTHDYIRHGTTCLYAALRVLDGVVLGACRPKRSSEEFVPFLNRLEQVTPAAQSIHVILDNLSTHKTPRVRRWLARHRRVHFRFIPTSSSWVNLVERWFAEITRARIRRGTFESVPALIAAIEDYLRHYNDAPRPFVWTKDADTILGSIERCPKALNARH